MAELVIADAHGSVRAEVELSSRTKVTLGASPKCDVVVEGEGISRHHALLVEESGVWMVLDLSATHGLWHGHDRVRCAAARESEPIRMGHLFLWFYGVRCEAPPALPALASTAPVLLRSEHLEWLWRAGIVAPHTGSVEATRVAA